MIDKRALSMMADIGIKDADSRLNRALKDAEKYIPRKVYAELADAHSGAVAAYSDVAILYGMRVAAVIQAVAANPAELTRFWLERRDASL